MTAHLSNPSPILVAAIVIAAIFALCAVTAWEGWRW